MTLVAASLEEKYFETRDNFIRQFEKSIDPDWMTAMKKDEHALAELEKQLKAIIGPVNVEGFPKEGKINLLTLQKDYGFGQVDGLRFSSKQEYLFFTTDNILKKYLAGQPELPKDLAELSKTGEFYVRAITAESAVTYFAEIPVKSANGKSYVRAFLGLTAQDIGCTGRISDKPCQRPESSRDEPANGKGLREGRCRSQQHERRHHDR